MGCDIGAVEIINTKLNTSLFLCRLSAEQLSPKSQPPPEMFCLPIFSARGSWWTGEAREEATEREEKGGQHIHVPGCARAAEPTGTAAAVAVQWTPQQFALRNKDISSRQKQLLAVAMTT